MPGGETVLVTGGGGFIGSHLVERLLGDGHRVQVLDNFATGRRENLAGVHGEIELVEGDLQSYERVHRAVRGCELVFHIGALPSVPRSVQDPLTSTNANVIGTLNVLLASRDEGVRRVVYASSSSVYGANTELPKREGQTPQPIAPYAVSKLAGEGYCRSFTPRSETQSAIASERRTVESRRMTTFAVGLSDSAGEGSPPACSWMRCPVCPPRAPGWLAPRSQRSSSAYRELVSCCVTAANRPRRWLTLVVAGRPPADVR